MQEDILRFLGHTVDCSVCVPKSQLCLLAQKARAAHGLMLFVITPHDGFEPEGVFRCFGKQLQFSTWDHHQLSICGHVDSPPSPLGVRKVDHFGPSA